MRLFYIFLLVLIVEFSHQRCLLWHNVVGGPILRYRSETMEYACHDLESFEQCKTAQLLLITNEFNETLNCYKYINCILNNNLINNNGKWWCINNISHTQCELASQLLDSKNITFVCNSIEKLDDLIEVIFYNIPNEIILTTESLTTKPETTKSPSISNKITPFIFLILLLSLLN